MAKTLKLVACKLVTVVVAIVVVPRVEIPDTHRPPDKIELPETVSWVMEVVAKVEVPLTVKSPVEVKSAKEPVAAVREETVPLIIMLSVEASPSMTSPDKVVVPATEASKLATNSPLTVKP